ncbi:hypothetical protein BDP55DRAFT_671178 [Colletotrichum godetiae]|uniref:Uncharacterized protein n=1 Tax=Colletotrichum godetiae TaxID=1209918 RepID=A0AAJ0AFV2_9PEZI|nr:uncharacterized protein BDP55DRAFT_671178 [Colletotrichum godetiae]KAK1673144.1 hypothetical protein BDP55DRAFT_671178 [Colletotrichum godetiae]
MPTALHLTASRNSPLRQRIQRLARFLRGNNIQMLRSAAARSHPVPTAHTKPQAARYVRHIGLRLVESDPEDEDPDIPWNQSRSPFGPAMLYLWDTLASWGFQESREGLTLEISSYTLAGLSIYTNYMPKDGVNHYSKHLETGNLGQYDDVEPFGHTGPLWFTHIGQSTSMLSGAVLRQADSHTATSHTERH